ncbi:MAG: flagellin lysine-N-methylase [Clostridia bacterium]|nr:flagellin lysine-N-methylase [Clostridia bacterium]
MQIMTPDYYKKFKCIAGDCKHSCCIGWEIDIDSDTLEIYNNIKGAWGEKLKKAISYDGDVPHFITDSNDRCPFLNKEGLCDIITEFGEDGLCQICYDHPRFRNCFSDRVEMGLGLCCEAATELILNSSNDLLFIVLESDGKEGSPTAEESIVFSQREQLFNLFKNREIPLKQTMQRVADEYNVIFDRDISSLVNTYRNLERLDPEWDECLNKTEQKSLDFDYILSLAERKIPQQARNLLCYFTYRYFANEGLLKNQQGAVKFMLEGTYFCLAVALSSCDDLNAKSFANVVRLFSSETEYSEENIRLLLN